MLFRKSLGEKHMTEFVEERLLIEDGKVEVPFKTVPKQNKPLTLESLYGIPKDKTQNDRKVVWKADRNVMQRLITSYEGGRNVIIRNVMRHELMPGSPHFYSRNRWITKSRYKVYTCDVADKSICLSSNKCGPVSFFLPIDRRDGSCL